MKKYHLTVNGKDTLCGEQSEDRIHTTYQDRILDDGKWCSSCKEFYKVNRSIDIMRNKDFIHNIITQVETIILSKMDKVPASWDGFELRLFIRDHFSQVAWHLGKDGSDFGWLEKESKYELQCQQHNLM